MHAHSSRRRFLATCALSLAVPALTDWSACAVEPLRRSGQPRLLLSLAAYSFRDSFRDSSHARNATAQGGKQIDLFDFIDFCAENGCTGTELTSYYFPKDFTPEFLVKLRRHAFLRGVAISGTAVGNTFTHAPGPARESEIAHVKKWIDHAALLGAPHIRIFAGTVPKGSTLEEAKGRVIAATDECGDYAGTKGIFLGIENHGGIVAEPTDLLEIVRGVKSPWVGINLDTGNFQTVDPYADLALCAPYAVNVQLKADIHRRGHPEEKADLKRLADILRAASYQGYVALEYESAEDPWQAVPRLLKQMKAVF